MTTVTIPTTGSSHISMIGPSNLEGPLDPTHEMGMGEDLVFKQPLTVGEERGSKKWQKVSGCLKIPTTTIGPNQLHDRPIGIWRGLGLGKETWEGAIAGSDILASSFLSLIIIKWRSAISSSYTWMCK